MRTVIFPRPGGPEVLEVVERPAPVAAPGQVLIQVTAAALNYADLLQRRGTYVMPAAGEIVLGMECSGVILAIGAGVTAWQPGDRVCALLPGGGYAEQVAVAGELVLPCPSGLTLLEAAALPEAACTVWSNLRGIGRLQAGDTVLIHGGAGGIGSLAVQCARHWGATVLATAGSPSKLQRCREWGAHQAIDYRQEDFVARVDALTAGRGVDIVLDNMGADYFTRNVHSLAADGRLLMIGLQGGRQASVDLGQMMSKRLALHTTSLRDRPLAAKAAIVQGVLAEIWPGLAQGAIKPVMDQVFALEDVARAHRYMESGRHIGKILLAAEHGL
jgi:putative PIG3 family NAD(P)H quinone oxidoreductase